MDEQGRVVGSAALAVGEAGVEASLRPRILAEYIGQEKVKANLRILLEAARQRGEAADHILLYGPPGLGKTTLAHIVGPELGGPNHAVEEILCPAMEDFAIDVMIGKGPSARSLRLNIKPFTVVGATTRAGRIGGPLRDRFRAVYRLDYYSEPELAEIIRR